MDNNQDYSLLIAQTLTKYFPFEQAKLKMYHTDDIYYRIPQLIFRLKETGGNGKYNEIKICIESFTGNLQWTIYKYEFSRKDNYVLAPRIAYDMERDYKESQCLDGEKIIPSDEYKAVCEKAIEDIPKLAQHIQKYFDSKKN